MGGRRNHWVTGRLPRRVSAPPWEPSRMAPRESKREQERRAWVARREGFKDESEAYEQRLARQRPGIRLEMGGPTRRSRPLKGAARVGTLSACTTTSRNDCSSEILAEPALVTAMSARRRWTHSPPQRRWSLHIT